MKRYIKSSMVPVMAGTKYDKKAAEILTKSGLFDAENSTKIIQTLFKEDIHAFNHGDPWLEKYLKGIARIIVEEAQGDPDKATAFIEQSTPVFNTYISYIRKLRDKLGGVDYDKQFIEKMSYENVKQAIKTLENDYYGELDIVKNSNGYTLIPIKDYEDLHRQFGGHWTGDGTDADGKYAGRGGSAWCHANDRYTYNTNYAKNGKNRFFILAANNWEDIPFDQESNAKNAKDAYGNSLIALVVNSRTGELINSTLRSNHKGHVEGYADNQYNYSQLSALAGFDVEAAIKEALSKPIELAYSGEGYISYNSKYGMLGGDTVELGGHTLYRIKALIDFSDVRSGYFGGYVESLDNLSEDGDCWVYDGAKVCENAKVTGNARIYDYAMIFGNAHITNSAKIYNHAHVYGNAKISGNSRIRGNAEVFGNAKIFGNAELNGSTVVDGYAWVFGDADVYNDVRVTGDARIFGNAVIGDSARIYDHATVCDHAIISGDAIIRENASICDHAYISGETVVTDNAEVFGDATISGNAIISGNAKVDYNVDSEEITE